MSTLILPLPPLPSSTSFGSLPFNLDLSCPISLPPRPVSGTAWPFAIAGPSSLSTESPDSFIGRRYLETLYLSDALFPLSSFIQDILRLLDVQAPNSRSLPEILGPHLLTLPQIETRHRKTLLPIFASLLSASANPSADAQTAQIEETLGSSVLDRAEQQVLRIALELRLGSKAASEGAVVQAKKLSEELEKRETLMQVALLFVYLSCHTSLAAPPRKKRKRDHRRRGSASMQAVAVDPAASLELLMDRLSVWSAVAELGIGMDVNPTDAKGKGKESGVQAMLRTFWEEIIVPHFIQQADLCGSFHVKVFGSPIPPKLLPPPPTTKKPRKPKLTHARPSSDKLTQLEMAVNTSTSRPPSEVGSRASPPTEKEREKEKERDRSMSRTTSRQRSESQSVSEFRRSRSRSVDPTPASAASKDGLEFTQPKKGLTRQPSGKDMFKGRQVGLMRRTTSIVVKRKDRDGAQSQAQSQGSVGLGRNESMGRIGLLGRKTSDPAKARRNSGESQNPQSQSQSQNRSQSQGTLIFATPSKPRLANSIFGPRVHSWVAPTPIQEEPSSNERPSYITETPVAHGRIAPFVPGSGSVVGDTPIGQNVHSRLGVLASSSGSRFGEMKIRGLSDDVIREGEEGGEEDEEDDELGELMVMTDDEAEEDDEDRVGGSHRGGLIPETPAR